MGCTSGTLTGLLSSSSSHNPTLASLSLRSRRLSAFTISKAPSFSNALPARTASWASTASPALSAPAARGRRCSLISCRCVGRWPCTRGASCWLRSRALFALHLQSLPGFWRFNLSVPDSRCDALRNGETRRAAGCPYFAACAPAESCLGNNTCADGYTGARCALCADGYYRFNASCAPCPSSPWAVIVGFTVGALAALGISYGLNKSGISLTLIAVGVDYAQVLSVFAQ